jgi:hypothetical protein
LSHSTALGDESQLCMKTVPWVTTDTRPCRADGFEFVVYGKVYRLRGM